MILEAIYSGDFYPSETVVPKSEKYRNIQLEALPLLLVLMRSW